MSKKSRKPHGDDASEKNGRVVMLEEGAKGDRIEKKHEGKKSGRVAKKTGGGKSRRIEENDEAMRRPREEYNGLSGFEMESIIGNLFENGCSPARIQMAVKDLYAIDITREFPNRSIVGAAKRKRIRYHAELDVFLRTCLKTRHPWLSEVRVVRTAVSLHVANHGAEELLNLVRELGRPPMRKKVVRIGLSGGIMVHQVAEAFARDVCALADDLDDLPGAIEFYGLVPAFDVNDPPTDPCAFYPEYARNPLLPLRMRAYRLRAPQMIMGRSHMDALRRMFPDIEDAFASTRELDVIVTGSSAWTDPHNTLRKCLRRYAPNTVKVYDDNECIGDVSWEGLNERGRIHADEAVMTLVPLEEFPGRIAAGTKVLLVLGPCCRCLRPKQGILGTILALGKEKEKRLVTHLVVDSRTAKCHFGQEGIWQGAPGPVGQLTPVGARV